MTLTGRTETGQAARDLVAAVRHVEGVVAVRDQLYSRARRNDPPA